MAHSSHTKSGKHDEAAAKNESAKPGKASHAAGPPKTINAHGDSTNHQPEARNKGGQGSGNRTKVT
ncbi:MAG TPA: hypothetical protein VGC80_02060 [Acetobacteraceae bacterium]|jgi:hypothetical protein